MKKLSPEELAWRLLVRTRVWIHAKYGKAALNAFNEDLSEYVVLATPKEWAAKGSKTPNLAPLT